MTAPLPDHLTVVEGRGEPEQVARPRRVRPALARWGRVVGARLAGPARLLPGVAAAVCACAGSWLLWGLGVALLVAAGLLLLVDARTPRS